MTTDSRSTTRTKSGSKSGSKSELGQNFLRDTRAVERIVAALGDISTRTVVEIGPGKAAITTLLAVRAKRLIAVELDRSLARALQGRFSPERGYGNVNVVQTDVLKFDFAAAAREAGEPLLVIGNLPYYISSPILQHLAQHSILPGDAATPAIERAVLMVQREVADRITAQPGSRDYGSLSATLQLYGSTEALFTLPPEAFEPPPEVYSTVFRWSFRPRFTELGVGQAGGEAAFLAFLKQCFALKRKTLVNNLRAVGYKSQAIAESMQAARIAPQLRAEAVGLKEFADLWKALQGQPTV